MLALVLVLVLLVAFTLWVIEGASGLLGGVS